MSAKLALEKLQSVRQEHLLTYWNGLQPAQRLHLLSQIEAFDSNLFRRQQALISATPPKEPFEAYSECNKSGDKEDQKEGSSLIAAGKVGCLLVAGGQGTRLGLTGPKGVFPISAIRNKSLFQLFAEKAVAASKQADRLLPLAVMTSPLNHRETVSFFESHQLFGLAPEQLSFYRQSTLPFLDPLGNLFLENCDSIATGPDGNGAAFQGLIESGIWEQWQKNGVKFVTFNLVDNPLADPFDANLIGFHQKTGCEISIKCIERIHKEESLGLLVRQGDRLRVVEYSEFPEQERLATLSDGRLVHRLANISLFCFSASFVNRLDSEKAFAKLPLHLAQKSAKFFGPIESISAWKFEKFIFDLIPLASSVKALLYPREQCFAPLKKPQDIGSVQQSLQQMDRHIYSKISGLQPSDRAFELAQDFYYPTPEILRYWQGRPLPDSEYIDVVVK